MGNEKFDLQVDFQGSVENSRCPESATTRMQLMRGGDNDLPVILLANKDLETHELLALKLGCGIVEKTLPAKELVALARAAVGRAGNENLPT